MAGWHVGERGLASRLEEFANSHTLASSLTGETVREVLREEVRILSGLEWAEVEVHLAPVGP